MSEKTCAACHWWNPPTKSVRSHCERTKIRSRSNDTCRNWLSDAQAKEQIHRDALQGRI